MVYNGKKFGGEIMKVERPLTILLVEDDPLSCQELSEAIDLTEEVMLADVTAHADQAVALIQDHIPDCLILDLELHAGSGNGLNNFIFTKHQTDYSAEKVIEFLCMIKDMIQNRPGNTPRKIYLMNRRTCGRNDLSEGSMRN